MTDGTTIKRLICDGRRFSETAQGWSVLADTMMPSGGVIEVFIQLRNGEIWMHDGGAAFDELARHGLEMKSLAGVRRMLAKADLTLTDDGEIFMSRLPIEKVAVGLAILADASLRAALYMLKHASPHRRDKLDARLKDVLRVQIPSGRSDFTFEGKRRQHRFDFGVALGDRTLLVEAVTPDSAAINAAIVKGIDARDAPGTNATPILVYDSSDNWSSASLQMLSLGGTGMTFERARQGLLLAA